MTLQGKTKAAITDQRLGCEITGAVPYRGRRRLEELCLPVLDEEAQRCRRLGVGLNHKSERLRLRNPKGHGINGADGLTEEATRREADVSVVSEREVDAREPEALAERRLERR